MKFQRCRRSLSLATGRVAALLCVIFAGTSPAAAQTAFFTFPPSNNYSQSQDNPQFRVQVNGGPASGSRRLQIRVDNNVFWERSIFFDSAGNADVPTRIPWFPTDINNHTVTALVQTGGGVFVNMDTRFDQRLSSAAETSFVVFHMLNESGSQQTMFSYNIWEMMDTSAGSFVDYFYDWLTDPLPDAINAQCASSERRSYRLLGTRTESVAANCTRLRTGATDGTNRCDDFKVRFDNIMGADPDRNRALHVFVVNSFEIQKPTGVFTALGLFPGGGRRWIVIVDSTPQLKQSSVIEHEFGHMAGLDHVNDPVSTPLDDCTQGDDRNLMCTSSGREMAASQCQTIRNAPLFNIY